MYCVTHVKCHIFQFDSRIHTNSNFFCLWAWKEYHISNPTWKVFLVQSCRLASSYMCSLVITDSLVTCSDQPFSLRCLFFFFERMEFLTWKLALNPICTGRHIFGQSTATADRENEPSIPYNVVWLLSYLPPANSNSLNFSTLWNHSNSVSDSQRVNFSNDKSELWQTTCQSQSKTNIGNEANVGTIAN